MSMSLREITVIIKSAYQANSARKAQPQEGILS